MTKKEIISGLLNMVCTILIVVSLFVSGCKSNTKSNDIGDSYMEKGSKYILIERLQISGDHNMYNIVVQKMGTKDTYAIFYDVLPEVYSLQNGVYKQVTGKRRTTPQNNVS